MVVLEGTTGSAPANDRATGWANILGSDPKFNTLASQTGDFTRDGGKKVMEGFLATYPNIDLVYAHNDDMGLGAIEAIEAAGKVPGKDIKIVTVDAVKAGMEALAAGKINFIVECSPLLGEQLFQASSAVLAGQEIPARVVTIESDLQSAAGHRRPCRPACTRPINRDVRICCSRIRASRCRTGAADGAHRCGTSDRVAKPHWSREMPNGARR